MPTWPDFLKIALSSWFRNLKKQNKRRTRISRWLGQENEENVARTRNYCGWPSSPLLTTYKHGNKENLSISSFFLITCKLVIWKKLVRSLRWRGGGILENIYHIFRNIYVSWCWGTSGSHICTSWVLLQLCYKSKMIFKQRVINIYLENYEILNAKNLAVYRVNKFYNKKKPKKLKLY